MLGNATYNVFKAASRDVTGLAHSRVPNHLTKLDLTDSQGVDAFFEATRPDCKLCYL